MPDGEGSFSTHQQPRVVTASLISFMIHITEMLISRLVVPVFVISLNAQFLFMDDICRFRISAGMVVIICHAGVQKQQLGFFGHHCTVQTHVVSCCSEYVKLTETGLTRPRRARLSSEEHIVLDEMIFEADTVS